MQIANIGCGYVADFYLRTLARHPELNLLGVMDQDQERARKFAKTYSVPTIYPTLDSLLSDSHIELVVNLTNPRSHFEVSKRALQAGKHVYSEKPLAMRFDQARELVELAKRKNLFIASAPCNVLGEAAQTVWKAVREGAIGQVYLAYAEMDDSLIHRTSYRKWASESGTPWPWKDEFEVGCTIEHAGYFLTWLAAFFGPAKRLTTFSKNLVCDKHTDEPLDVSAPDFSLGVIEFHTGVVARLTCSIVAPANRSLMIVGEEGILTVADCWDYHSTVRIQKTPFGRRRERIWPFTHLFGLAPRKLPPVRRARHLTRNHIMDFYRGAADMAAAIRAGQTPRISPEFSLHMAELALAIQDSQPRESRLTLETSFDEMAPMPWAD